MQYTYKGLEKTLKKMKGEDGGIWGYLSVKTFLSKKKYKESIIFGDVTGKACHFISDSSDSVHSYISMVQDEEMKTMRIYRSRDRFSFFDEILGYISVTNSNGVEGYVRIRKKSFKKIGIMVLLSLIIVLGIMTMFIRRTESGLDKNAIAYQLPEGVKNTDPESIMLPGFKKVGMNSVTQKVDIALLNPDGNDCYFRYRIVLKNGDDELHQTGLIKPGTAVTNFISKVKLEKGSYPIIINVDAVDLKDPKKSFNGGAVEAVLEVK